MTTWMGVKVHVGIDIKAYLHIIMTDTDQWIYMDAYAYFLAIWKILYCVKSSHLGNINDFHTPNTPSN